MKCSNLNMSNYCYQLPEARNALPTADCVSSEQTKVFAHFLFAHSFQVKSLHKKIARRRSSKGGWVWPRARLWGPAVRSWPGPRWRNWWEPFFCWYLVKIFFPHIVNIGGLVKTFLLTLVIADWWIGENLFCSDWWHWSKLSLSHQNQRLEFRALKDKNQQYHVKVRAYKEGSYRAVARVEEGSESSGRERALWWSTSPRSLVITGDRQSWKLWSPTFSGSPWHPWTLKRILDTLVINLLGSFLTT